MKIVVLITCLVFIIGGAAHAQESVSFTYPHPTGAFAVGRTAYGWTDTNREEVFTDDPNDNRETPVTVWYPAIPDDAPPAPWMDLDLARGFEAQVGVPLEDMISLITVQAGADAPLAEFDTPFPVIIMSHGVGLLPQLYTLTAEQLASHGYVVFGVTHPYNAFGALLAEGDVVLASPAANPANIEVAPDASAPDIGDATDARGARLLDVQANDLRFVLDRIVLLNEADARFKGRLDVVHVGVFGHSFGGAAALMALLAEPRFAAAALIDSSLFADAPEGIDRPVLGIFADATLALATPTEADFAELDLRPEEIERLTRTMGRVLDVMSSSQHAYFVAITGADHMNFNDSGLLAGVLPGLSAQLGIIDPVLALDITNAYLLAFFDETLRGEPSRLGDLPTQYPESTLEGQ